MKIKNKRVVGRVAGMILFIAVLNIGYWAYHHIHSPISAMYRGEAAEIAALKPENQRVTVTNRYIGQVEAINQIEIVPYISGYITEIKAQGGQTVKKGDVLAILKQEEYIAALAEATAAVAAAEADYDNALTTYNRMQKAGPRAVSPLDLDNAKAAYLTAEADLQKSRAGELSARTDLEYTYLKAPFDGVLGNIGVSVGEYVSPQSTNIMELVQYNPIRVVFSVTDKEYLNHLQAVDKNLKIGLKLANGEIYDYEGKIVYAANVIDKQTDSLAVYAEFANPDKTLMPNAYAELLLERTYDNVFLLDKNRIVLKPEGDFVYVTDNNVVIEHKVTVLGDYNNQYVIKNDFPPEMFLIEENIEPSLLGQTVKIKDSQVEK
ncbi:MAG: efflux RND transporter periplasmic adaptor subunit [Alphaproteobacteria bacterium]|nr:efflux RND transporter periplasmic adaptor subunit [Alphaproteobacteria bacterium]